MTSSPRLPVDALMTVANRPDTVFTRGDGSWLWDEHGRRHLDLVQGWAVNTLGHAAPEIAAALAAQAGRVLHVGPGFHNDRAIALAGRLTALSGLDRCFFTNSGAEANEGAIKLARKFGQVHRGGAYEIITFEHSFHGRTLATMSASGKPGFDTLFAPQVPGFPKARLNNLASVEALVNANTVAVMLEPIQGEAGVVEATPGFLQALRTLCDSRGLLLVLDEVQTGVGRTGTWWGHDAAGVVPDIMTLGKGLGGGVPIGALLAREAVCCFAPGDQGGTYNGNALVCAAALAVVNAVDAPSFLPNVQARSHQLRTGLDRIGHRVGSPPVRGRGLLLALDLPGAGQALQVAETLRLRAETGVLVNAVRPQRLRLIPALNITEAEVALALAALEEAIP
ncbi:acetylornithine transaminase [Rhizobacter sp. Root1221]|uniref:acetylornithine transaminase n=1 Tax=Rhizobacter sp. Root1221 TaxID=1736433 RepID=UPI00070122F2|nr:acetylornithine transaminase [Rhizobacter sp. Root1221]KQW02271.1 acetylornithine aminotransferase [Rhizobacter sp. Root1221]